jgi:DNA-binding NarL/FixJ family response regulator
MDAEVNRVDDGRGHDMAGPIAKLTPTQLKVLRGVHSGLLNKQIAYDLGIAEATVKAHMTALMRKLNVRNRTQVAIAAQTLGWNRLAPDAEVRHTH